ncbi:hypothetical protein BASA60_001751 [Batrachochytrium salamandrivorans]|nr:hypothetical protein BASA60_001751 [Batrachochytrium salamandrivorans]
MTGQRQKNAHPMWDQHRGEQTESNQIRSHQVETIRSEVISNPSPSSETQIQVPTNQESPECSRNHHESEVIKSGSQPVEPSESAKASNQRGPRHTIRSEVINSGLQVINQSVSEVTIRINQFQKPQIRNLRKSVRSWGNKSGVHRDRESMKPTPERRV